LERHRDLIEDVTPKSRKDYINTGVSAQQVSREERTTGAMSRMGFNESTLRTWSLIEKKYVTSRKMKIRAKKAGVTGG